MKTRIAGAMLAVMMAFGAMLPVAEASNRHRGWYGHGHRGGHYHRHGDHYDYYPFPHRYHSGRHYGGWYAPRYSFSFGSPYYGGYRGGYYGGYGGYGGYWW